MKLVARITKRYDLKSHNDVSDWRWHFYYNVNEFPITMASIFGHFNVVRYLHENGADMHVRHENTIRTAALHGHLDIVRYLYENGANMQDALFHASPGAYNNLCKVCGTAS